MLSSSQNAAIEKGKMMEWISVKNKLPPYSLDVLITDGEDVEIGCLDRVGWLRDSLNTITHWMPLPKVQNE